MVQYTKWARSLQAVLQLSNSLTLTIHFGTGHQQEWYWPMLTNWFFAMYALNHLLKLCNYIGGVQSYFTGFPCVSDNIANIPRILQSNSWHIYIHIMYVLGYFKYIHHVTYNLPVFRYALRDISYDKKNLLFDCNQTMFACNPYQIK